MLSRRHLLVLVGLSSFFGIGFLGALWRWKAPSLLEKRLERITGHRTSVGSLSVTYRFDLVANDVRIAGAPPFDSQTLARADRVTLRLNGPDGLLSPSDIQIDGLDIEYLGTASGDNLRGLRSQTKKATASPGPATRRPSPALHANNARLRGSIALPHGPHLAFRVPQLDIERTPDGRLHASLLRAVLDAEGLVSVHALALALNRDKEQLTLASNGNFTVDVAGGGPLLDGLVLDASLRGSEATFKLSGGASAQQRVLISGQWNRQTIELSANVQSIPLRPLGVITARHALGLDDATASFHATAAVDRPSLRAKIALDAGIRGIDLLHPAIDTSPWRNQDASIALQGTVDLATGRIDLAAGNLRLPFASFTLGGWLELPAGPRGSISISTPRHAPLPCAALLLGQPAPVQRALAGLELDGRLGLSVGMEFDANAWEDLKLDVNVDPICSVKKDADVLARMLPVLRQSSEPMRIPTKLPLGSFHPDFVPLSVMPRHLTGAFLTAEDGKFFRHHGFDLEMIRLALAQNLQNHSFQRGASTITQQLVKNLFLSHRRTLARKLEEAVLTWRVQHLLSKDRVLELYLNVIELGPGIRGVKQAARVYFGKDVSSLTPLESAHLAALTPNPHALARRFRDGKVDEGWHQRLLDLLAMMRRNGRISSEELATARSSKLVLRELGPQ